MFGQLPRIKTDTAYTRLAGGINKVSPPLGMDAGSAISAMNYESLALGGYKRIDGYERFDGRESPSLARYLHCKVNFSGAVNVGDTVTGVTSGATGKVIYVTDTEIALTKVTGSNLFTVESFTVGGVTKGSFTVAPLLDGHPTGLGHATILNAAANVYRQDIQPVAGSGVIRGVLMFKGVAYAFRNNVAGTAVDIYKSTANGWVNVPLYKSIDYKNGALKIADGTVITQVGTGATATVKRQTLESGSFDLSDNLSNDYATTAISVTSVALSVADLTFTTIAGKDFTAGMPVNVTATADTTKWAYGVVKTYDRTTGALVVTVTNINGSGTFASWEIKQAYDRAKGRLILANVTGTFNATDDIQVGGITVAKADSLVTQISIQSGGRYEFIQHNFYGSTATQRVYGCDSLNPAFEFDGDVYVPIRTGMNVDAPTHIIAHRKMLFLAFAGSVQNSGVGEPHVWSVGSAGINEIGIGDDISGFVVGVGEVLAIFARDSCYQLVGQDRSNFQLNVLSPDMGAIPYGVQNLGFIYAFDDRGIIRIQPSAVYGGFESETVSRVIQPIIDTFREKIVASSIYKTRNQARYYASDGSGICMTLYEGRNGIEHHFTQFKYPISISCAFTGEDASGRDIVLIGSDNGYVYVMDKGSSFDGQDIEAYLRLAFNNLKSPSSIKRFRKVEMEMSAVGYSAIRYHPDFSYADPNVATHLKQWDEVQGQGGYWDESIFNTFYWDGKIVNQPKFNITGSGINIGMVMYSKSAIDLGHTLSGMIIYYTARRLTR